MNPEEKRKAFLERQYHIKREDLSGTYYSPTHVQFNVKVYDDLNPQNKEKLRRFLKEAEERGLHYDVEGIMKEIRKYDTSVLDALLTYAFTGRYY